jgi:hypothetical protein
MERYRIVSELTEQQISELTDLYRNEFWSQNRTQQDVAKMLAASDIVIGLLDECDQLLAFIRVLLKSIRLSEIKGVRSLKNG